MTGSKPPAVPAPGTDPVYERHADQPIIRHWGWTHDPLVALCGERLIGVPAPVSHPYFCEECERLHAEYIARCGAAS